MSIADNIKRLRTAENLSQAELGKIAGVTDKAVSTWESGLKIPRMGAVEKMASHFGIPKSAILDDTPVLQSAIDNTSESSSERQRFNDFVSSLDEEQLKKFLEIGKVMFGDK